LWRRRENVTISFFRGDAVPYPNDRRKSHAEADEVLSPEYLAMLIACGGEVRAGDHETRRGAQFEQRHGRRKDDLPMPDPGKTAYLG
jgi:hypothetical protein